MSPHHPSSKRAAPHAQSKDTLATRALAWQALRAILLDQRPLDDALPPSTYSEYTQVKSLVMPALIYKTGWDTLLKQHMKRLPRGKEAGLLPLFYLALAEIHVLQHAAYGVIDSCVSMARKAGFHRQSGMVNALLRNLADTKPPLENAQSILPEWMWERYTRIYGAEITNALAHAIASPAALDITCMHNPKAWVEPLEAEYIAPATLRLRPKTSVRALPGYDTGNWWVQDHAASLPVTMLGDIRGKRVLDICAAPGGKTAQCCALGADVTALDISSHRVRRLQENMQRLGFSPAIIVGDMFAYNPDTLYDAILLDAPCSATGTMRRHPDVMHHRNEADILRMQHIQRDALLHCASMVRIGGVMVYATCSLEPEEGEEQITHFLANHTNWRLADNGILRTLPHPVAMDGFFAARLERVS